MPKIRVTRGTDIKTVLVYTDPAGAPIDLTGATYRVFDNPTFLDGKITFTDNTPLAGKVNMRVEWGDDIPDYANTRANEELPSFRVQMLTGGDHAGTEEIILEYV